MRATSRRRASSLQSAFDLLHQAREYFYPVQTHLLDLTLVAPSTLGRVAARRVGLGRCRRIC